MSTRKERSPGNCIPGRPFLCVVLNTANLLRERAIHIRSIPVGVDPAKSTGPPMLNLMVTLAEY